MDILDTEGNEMKPMETRNTEGKDVKQMKSRGKMLLALATALTVVGLAAGGTILRDRTAYAAPNDPPTTTSTDWICGGGGLGPNGGMGGMMGGAGGIGGMMGFLDRVTLDNLSKLTGISAQDLLNQLQQGKSLIEVTGKDEQTLVSLITAPHKEQMQLRVTQGYLTPEQASQMTTSMEQAARTFVNSKSLGEGRGFGMHGSFGGNGAPSTGTAPRGGTGMMGGGNGGYGGMMGGGMMGSGRSF